ncbi:Dihydroorotase [Arachis hypogaea]|nr:Dihydroorotase [Arachis hypogaea]
MLHGTLAPPASSSSSQHPIPNAAVAYELFSSVSVHPRCCRSSFPRSFLLALLVLLGAAVGVAASVLIVIGHPELVSLSSLSSPLSRARVKPLSSIPWLSELTFLPPSPSLLFLPCHRKQSYFNLCFLILLFYPRPSKLLSLSSEGRFEASVIVIVESYLTGSVPTTLPSTTALPSAPLKPNPNTRITLSSLHSPGFSRSHQRLTTLCRRRIPSQSRPHPAHNALLHFVLRHSFPSTVVVSIQRLRCLSGFSPAISVVSPSSISLSPIGFFCQKLCSVAASATGCVAGGPVDVLVAVGVVFRVNLYTSHGSVIIVGTMMELSITQPDDWHLHLRDGDLLEGVIPHSAKHFGRAIVMPNLKPPITTTAAALAYRESILKALPKDSSFTPLMTLYLTDMTSPDEIKRAKKSGAVYGVKLYPAGATTNSQDGVTDLFGKCFPVLEEMVEQELPLLVHGEVTNPNVDIFDREKVYIETILEPLVQKLPQLKIVMEHITTMDAVKFVMSCKEGSVGATVTPQHLILNRNALFQGGLQPHNYCLPVLKREIHRQAIVSAVTSGSKRFFLGTDSAPHEKRKKECACGCAGIFNAPVALSVYAKVFEEAGALNKLEAFTSFNGSDFYGLPRNKSKLTLKKAPWKVPELLSFPFGDIVPMFAGETLEWEVSLN